MDRQEPPGVLWSEYAVLWWVQIAEWAELHDILCDVALCTDIVLFFLLIWIVEPSISASGQRAGVEI